MTPGFYVLLGKLIRDVEISEADFRLVHPAYDEAIERLKALLLIELEAGGHSGQEALTAMYQTLVDVAQAALVDRRDPARALFEFAQQRCLSPHVPQSGAIH